MDFSNIIRRSYEIIKGRRYLWWLGILAALTEGGYARMGQYNFNGVDFNKLMNDATGNPTSDSSQVLGTATSWLGQTTVITIIALVFVVITLLIWYISYSAKAGLIQSVDRVDRGEDSWKFADAFKSGRKFVLRLFVFALLGFLSVLLLLIIFGIPIALLFLMHQTVGTVIAVILVIIGVLGLLALAIFLSVILPLVERNIVLHQDSIWPAILNACKTLKAQPGKVFLSYLVNAGLGLAYSMAVGMAAFLVGSLLFGIGYALWGLNHTATIIYAAIVGIALLATLIGFAGIFTSFLSAYWTLAYKEITKA